MTPSSRLQLIISGTGGQGVLFVTRLLAEAALQRGHAVLASETHGMAQRGGTVISHLKIGGFAGPLIRPRQADGLITLHVENLPFHAGFLTPQGWAVVNCAALPAQVPDCTLYPIDAYPLAEALGHPKSANLVTLGFALNHINRQFDLAPLEDVMALLDGMGGDEKRRQMGREALRAGYARGREMSA